MWEISVSGQAAAFCYSVVLGAMLGVFYDIIRATRRAGANSFVAVFIGDILFWIISAFAVFIFLMAVTNGEIRGYILFACLIGAVIYFLTLGRPVALLLGSLFCRAAKVWRKASAATARGCAFIEKHISRAATYTVKAVKRFFKLLKKLLKKVRELLYTDKDKKETE